MYVVLCLLLINLSLASIKRTPETPWNYKRGGVNVTWNDKQIRQLIEENQGIARGFEDTDVRNRYTFLIHGKQEIPEFFDARKKWPMCKSLSRIKRQYSCTTCWAGAAASSVSDRLCISSKETQQFDISEQDIVTCCKECYESTSSSRCHSGGTLVSPIMYMFKYGAVLAECKPFNMTIIENGCKHSCSKKTVSYKKHKLDFSSIVMGAVAGNIPLSTLQDVQIEIMKYGPVLARISYVPLDFAENYTSEVYIDTNSELSHHFGHAVKIIGWGTDNGTPYWLCANSWGEKWGKLGGFYKIRRGANELGIEEYFIAVDTDPKNRPKWIDASATTASAISFIQILQKYKITVFVVIVINI